MRVSATAERTRLREAMQILIVEDEAKIAQAIREGLEAAGFTTSVASTGEDGLFQAIEQSFDLIVLDIMLPGRSGLDMLAALRRHGHKTPVIVVTARDTVGDRVLGLDMGADDYLVKPFAFAELLARVRSLLRRGRGDPVLRHVVADVEMDLLRRAVTRAGESIQLTPLEFDLFEYLVRHKNQIVSREMLARDVWKESGRATTLDNIIDVHIGRIRRKIDSGRTPLIRTVRGVGFTVQDTQ